MKHFLIANPHARNGRGAMAFRQLQARLERHRIRYDWALCEGMDHARVLSEEANRAGYDVIVAVGGDGTINRVLNGFFDANGRRISSARMGVVHIGTSPDFCRSRGIPTALEPAVATLAEGASHAVSVGRILYEGAPGPAPSADLPSACFGCCANIGLGAAVARLANSGIRRFAGDIPGTFLALVRTLTRYRPHTLQLALDGERRTVPGVYNISVGKTFHIASGLKVRHELSDLDSRLYVLGLRNLSWLSLGRILPCLYRGRPITPGPCLSLQYARSVALASAAAVVVEVEFDGDPAGRCPCRIETAADPLDLIVSKAA